jgi:hypothetical protein
MRRNPGQRTTIWMCHWLKERLTSFPTMMKGVLEDKHTWAVCNRRLQSYLLRLILGRMTRDLVLVLRQYPKGTFRPQALVGGERSTSNLLRCHVWTWISLMWKNTGWEMARQETVKAKAQACLGPKIMMRNVKERSVCADQATVSNLSTILRSSWSF